MDGTREGPVHLRLKDKSNSTLCQSQNMFVPTERLKYCFPQSRGIKKTHKCFINMKELDVSCVVLILSHRKLKPSGAQKVV